MPWWNCAVEKHKEAIITCTPNTAVAADGHPHLIAFNRDYVTEYDNSTKQQVNRVAFLHVVKLLHEISHSITPSFVRLSERFTTGENLDLNTAEKLGACSAWEDSIFGGRLLPGKQSHNMFSVPLKLKIMKDPTAAREKGNFTLVDIPDTFVAAKLKELEKWASGKPLPNLNARAFIESSTTTAPEVPASAETFEASECSLTSSAGGASAAITGYKRKSAGQYEEEDTEESFDEEGAEMSAEYYQYLVSLGAAMSAEQARLYAAGQKF